MKTAHGMTKTRHNKRQFGSVARQYRIEGSRPAIISRFWVGKMAVSAEQNSPIKCDMAPAEYVAMPF